MCTILTCPTSRNININSMCKLVVPNLIPELIVAGNCNLPVTIVQTPAGGTAITAIHNQTQVVTFMVTDNAGLTASCTLTLTAKDVAAPVLTNCATSVINLIMTTACKVTIPNVATITNATDCSPITKVQTPAAGTILTATNNQTFTMSIVVTDAAGNTATCNRTLVAKDQTKPVITLCPSPVSAARLAGTCSIVVPDRRSATTATDQCSNPVVITQNPAQGSTVSAPNPTLLITMIATDGSGNTSTCTATVNVTGTCTLFTGNGGSNLLGQNGELTQAESLPKGAIKNELFVKPLDLQALPNPFSDELTVAFDLPETASTRLVLMDLTGKFVFLEKEARYEAGRQRFVWNTEDLPAGAYLLGLKVESANESGWTYRKIMLVR